MKPIARNVLAVVLGVVIGGMVNMGLIHLGSIVVPLPDGADVTTMEGLQESMKLFTPVNFLFPFLAHALGTLVGAFVAAKVAASHQMKFAIGIGLLFLVGGAMMISMLGGPMWFNVTDLVLAYLPMGYLGGVLARGKKLPAASPSIACKWSNRVSLLRHYRVFRVVDWSRICIVSECQ